MHPLRALVCQYLDGDIVSREVLNDALEELGRDRSAVSGEPTDRMNAVLEKILPETLGHSVAVDFAEHVASICDNKDTAEILTMKRELLQPGASESDRLHFLRELHSLGWEPNNSEKSNAIWAVWSALLIAPKHVAAAARRARKNELDWQMNHLKSIVLAKL